MTFSKSKIVQFGPPTAVGSIGSSAALPGADAIMASEIGAGNATTRDALETAPAHVARHRWVLFVMDEICEYADKYQLPETAEALRKVILTAEAEIIGKRN